MVERDILHWLEVQGMAGAWCAQRYTHIGLLTSKGLAQREEWRRRMEEKEVMKWNDPSMALEL
jgi:hypothetical protein